MIACVDPDRAAPPFAIAAPQLERLDERALLFVVTVQQDRAFVVATIDGGDGGSATTHHHDITELLPRLGCPGAADLAAWAITPRMLTPTDVDVLCYALQIPLPGERPPPRPVIERTRAEVLLRAIHADPASDDERLVYADFLQDQGDPYGELIVLQIARAHSGGAPSAHERALLHWYASAAALPLTPYLRFGFELRRGFLGACAVDDALPDALLADPAWSTVESIETRRYAVLTNPQLRAVRRAVTDTACLIRLVRESTAQPFETIVGVASHGLHSGIYIGDRGEWRRLTEIGALLHLRTLALQAANDDQDHVAELIGGRLGAQLAHLDLHVRTGVDSRRWRERFDAAKLPRLVLRLWRGDRAHVAIALERGSPHRLRLELHDGLGLLRHHYPELHALLAALGSGLQRIEVTETGTTSAAWLRDELRALFPQVVDGQPASWWSL